ncbi:MAG: isochorismate synthase [Thermomicrobiales bacterium]|nr:isochorismate synthase [Thermomicrobiales bacterium]
MTPTLFLEPPATATSGDIETAVHWARQLGRPTLVSRIEPLSAPPDPLAFLHASARELGHGVLWEQSPAGIAFAGAGAATTISAQGVSRFGSVAAAIADLTPRLIRDDESAVFPLIGGFAFGPGTEQSPVWRDFPDALFVVPQVLLQIAAGTAYLRVSMPVDPISSPAEVQSALRSTMERARGWAERALPVTERHAAVGRHSVPERPVWESSVATAVSLIQQDQLDKVVLAREERLLFDQTISPVATLARLRESDPDATRFALQTSNSWFIGSTPERLVRLRAGRVDVTCLAGSIGIGQDEEETRRLAARLLASAKDREEHDIVVRSTIGALEDTCEDVASAPGSPRVARARSVQHLETPISARMPHAGHVLDLVECLHPTPAVGGFPRERALAAIRELEAIDRGWYAAPFGWTDLHGDGEFAVAIRSALLSGRSASLFAGCGIVADSVPAAEWEETCLKLRPMLAALGVA